MQQEFKKILIDMIKPLLREEVELIYTKNSVDKLYSDLFSDFFISLTSIVKNTYLGFETSDLSKTKYEYEDNKKHFYWCLEKTINEFKKENIEIEINSVNYNFIFSFYNDIFYIPNNATVVDAYFLKLFNLEEERTKMDISLFLDLYKIMKDSLVNLKKNEQWNNYY